MVPDEIVQELCRSIEEDYSRWDNHGNILKDRNTGLIYWAGGGPIINVYGEGDYQEVFTMGQGKKIRDSLRISRDRLSNESKSRVSKNVVRSFTPGETQIPYEEIIRKESICSRLLSWWNK